MLFSKSLNGTLRPAQNTMNECNGAPRPLGACAFQFGESIVNMGKNIEGERGESAQIFIVLRVFALETVEI